MRKILFLFAFLLLGSVQLFGFSNTWQWENGVCKIWANITNQCEVMQYSYRDGPNFRCNETRYACFVRVYRSPGRSYWVIDGNNGSSMTLQTPRERESFSPVLPYGFY